VAPPGIEKAFRKDVDAFYLAARMVELFLPDAPPAAENGGDRCFSMASYGASWKFALRIPAASLNLPRTPKGDARVSNCLRSNGNFRRRVDDAGLGRWRIHGG